MSPDDAPRPLLRVVRGDPTAEELAALVAVVAAGRATAPASAGPAGHPRTWSAYWRTVGAGPRPGPGSWRASALPR